MYNQTVAESFKHCNESQSAYQGVCGNCDVCMFGVELPVLHDAFRRRLHVAVQFGFKLTKTLSGADSLSLVKTCILFQNNYIDTCRFWQCELTELVYKKKSTLVR